MTDAALQQRFGAAVTEFDGRVRAVRPDQWSAPTPCPDWNVRALVNHLVGELAWMPPLLAGKTIADVGDQLDGDLLGDDPVAAWDDAVRQASAVVNEPGALDSTVHLSYGQTPAAAYVTEVAADLTVHAWDLARGIGAD
ncbi:MAG: TIGR03086 family metal-binding protein, partial [Sporichthyaceae bacterium]|nr:TIGR03086 family metal-binding protein [Sporichthyaceae bacterium]